MKIELDIAVIKDEDGNFRTDIGDSESPDKSQRAWLDPRSESLVLVCRVILEDQGTTGINYLPATAYEVMQGIDMMSDIPHMHDLLMDIATTMFQEGMKFQADQAVNYETPNCPFF